jgi:hypothetical protein
MLRSFHPGNPGIKAGLELAGVQMPPSDLFGVIPTGKFLPAFRTRPLGPGRMLRPYIHMVFGKLQIRLSYKPRIFQTQNGLVKVGVPHLKPLIGDSLYNTYPPTPNPEVSKEEYYETDNKR